MVDIRYKNLQTLLSDMESKKWMIDSFPFTYNRVDTFVILKRYKENSRKPSKFAKAKLEFIKCEDIHDSVKGYMDFYEVYFDSAPRFFEFFNITDRGAGRNAFLDFSIYFAQFIPENKVVIKNDDTERRLLGSRAEGNNPNAVYCFDVRRNGTKENGDPNERSIENSNKAEVLRPDLYENYKDELNLSFFFSENEEDELSDEEIMRNIANRD